MYYVDNAGVKDVLQWYREKLSDYEVADELSMTTITTPQGSVEWGGILFKKGIMLLVYGL